MSIVVFALLMFALSGCASKDYGDAFTTRPLTERGYEIETYQVECEGVTEDVNLLITADLHIIISNDEVDDGNREEVDRRIVSFKKQGDKTSSANRWETLPLLLDKCNADYLLFAGDMVDFASEANISELKDGFEKLQSQYMYVRADHDLAPYYMTDMSGYAYEKSFNMQKDASVMKDAWYADLDEIVILAVNNSTSQITTEALEVVKEAISIGKPIILLTHVPINSLVDSSLAESSRAVFSDRNLTWGISGDEYYQADEITKEFLNLIYADNSPVKEIVCGHLHYSWEGMVTENTHEIVFSPAFDGKIGLLKVTGIK